MPARSRRGAHKRLTLGRILVVAMLVMGGALFYLASYSGQGSKASGFPFPCAAGEGAALHIHPYLEIIANGQNVSIPAGIGDTDCIQPIHTHDASGIIHIEPSSASPQYTLGEFFQAWDATYHTVTIGGAQHPIVFNSTDILGLRSDATHKVVLLVDGKPSSSFGALVLNSLDYCSAKSTGPPCAPTAVGDPYYNGLAYPYGTGHTIVIEYETVSG